MGLLEEGETIRDGSYHIERFIGSGAFAEVYRVKHHIFGRQALKIFKTPGTFSEVKVMLEEAKLLTHFRHTNIIRVYEAGLHKARSGIHGFFTMEFLDGGTLAAYRLSHKERFVPVPVTVDIMRQLCRGLSLTHTSHPPLIHRDIKPQNILIEEGAGMPRICISDFGLAKHANRLTLKASVRGALAYRAPECYTDPQAASCAADVYSLGAVIYLMLTDRFPYSGADLDEIKPNHFKRPLCPASRINAGVDEHLDAILARALAVNPEKRYTNASAMLDDLETYHVTDNRKGETTVNDAPSGESGAINADNKKGEKTLSLDAVQEARQMVKKAVELSRTNLGEAADLLEKAMDHFSPYREEYKGLLTAWRNGQRM